MIENILYYGWFETIGCIFEFLKMKNFTVVFRMLQKIKLKTWSNVTFLLLFTIIMYGFIFSYIWLFDRNRLELVV